MTPCLKEKEDYEWTKNGLDYTREKGDQGDKGDHGVGVAKCSAFDFFMDFWAYSWSVTVSLFVVMPRNSV